MTGEKQIPTLKQLEKELKRETCREYYFRILRSTVSVLIVVAAAAVLTATLLLPVLRIYGTSMTPGLANGDLVISVRGSSFEQGDVISFYYNNRILVKRVIAGPGDWVNIDEEGNVTVNGELLDEPYVQEKARGECDISLPYQVPDGRWFVMGDHRSVSVDSRSTEIGCVAEEQIVGKLIFKIWPLNRFGPVE